ncbi:hypothetical protein MLD52_09690 [Puniceicoccaceae bacterium K14]|nr:hypothetical protein [Puniceicoccaceae bacterium K14]
MAPRRGFEPHDENEQNTDDQLTYKNKESDSPQIAPQEFGTSDPKLVRIVSSWSDLTDTRKKAIMAILEI